MRLPVPVARNAPSWLKAAARTFPLKLIRLRTTPEIASNRIPYPSTSIESTSLPNLEVFTGIVTIKSVADRISGRAVDE